MKRTGVTVARQLKKHNQPRVQTLAVRRVRIAAWQMVSCPSDGNCRRYWEESVTRRCDEMWRDEYIKMSKEDYRNVTQWKRLSQVDQTTGSVLSRVSWVTPGYRNWRLATRGLSGSH